MTAVLETRDLTKQFVRKLDVAAKIAAAIGADVVEEIVHAVDQVSFSIDKGEVVGLVGESGCGKSTVGRMIAGILPKTQGSILYRGKDTEQLRSEDLKHYQLSPLRQPLSRYSVLCRLSSFLTAQFSVSLQG